MGHAASSAFINAIKFELLDRRVSTSGPFGAEVLDFLHRRKLAFLNGPDKNYLLCKGKYRCTAKLMFCLPAVWPVRGINLKYLPVYYNVYMHSGHKVFSTLLQSLTKH